jgi:hypothetical protein
VNKPIAKIDFRPLSGPVITWHLPPKKIGAYEVYAIDPGGQPHGQPMTPKQQDERSRAACIAGFIAASKHRPHLRTTRVILEAAEKYADLYLSRTNLEAQGDVAKDERDTWTAGDFYKETYADHFEAGIDHHGEPRNVSTDGTWGHRIVCYGATEREAIDLRDKVLAAITTDAEAKP